MIDLLLKWTNPYFVNVPDAQCYPSEYPFEKHCLSSSPCECVTSADEAAFASGGQASTRHVGQQHVAPDTSLWSGFKASHVSPVPE